MAIWTTDVKSLRCKCFLQLGTQPIVYPKTAHKEDRLIINVHQHELKQKKWFWFTSAVDASHCSLNRLDGIAQTAQKRVTVKQQN